MVKCGLCDEEVPEDNAGMGQTIKVAHVHQHSVEMKSLGMDISQYTDYCRSKRLGI